MTVSWTEVSPFVERATLQVWPRWRRWVSEEDFKATLWAWVAENQPLVTQMIKNEYKAQLVTKLRGVGEVYARAEKAARSGYSPSDEVFYSKRKLASMLPDAFNPEATPPIETYHENGLYTEWAAELADIRRVLKSKRLLPLNDYWVLRAYAHGEKEYNDKDVQHSLWVLQSRLGGAKPRRGNQ